MVEKFEEQHKSESNKMKLRVDADLIVNRIVGDDGRWLPEKKAELKNHYEGLLHQYSEIELTLPIDNEPMKRVCQVLTNNGFITQDSCEGHGERLPHIFLLVKTNNSYAHLPMSSQEHLNLSGSRGTSKYGAATLI